MTTEQQNPAPFRPDLPYFKMFGMRFDTIGSGFAQVSMDYDKKFNQPFGIMHAGAIVSLADTAISAAVQSMLKHPEYHTTAEFKFNFLVPITRGKIIAQARVVKRGRRLSMAEVNVVNEQKKLMAKALATCMILNMDNP